MQYASPATISRCGMVYVDPKNLGYEPYWQKWVGERSNVIEQEELNKLFKKFVPSSIDLITDGVRDGKKMERLKTIVPLTSLNMVRCFFSTFFFSGNSFVCIFLCLLCFASQPGWRFYSESHHCTIRASKGKKRGKGTVSR